MSDFVSELWSRLRDDNRLGALQGQVFYGGALSGRDTTAVNKTINGLLKLLYPDREMEIADEDVEWAVTQPGQPRRQPRSDSGPIDTPSSELPGLV